MASSSGEELRLGDRPVGRLSSVVESPRLGTIALALVRREASPGDALAVGEHGATAELVELPFLGGAGLPAAGPALVQMLADRRPQHLQRVGARRGVEGVGDVGAPQVGFRALQPAGADPRRDCVQSSPLSSVGTPDS